MRIVVTGPAPVQELAPHLGLDRADLPVGMPGTPVVALVQHLAAMGHRPVLVTCDRGVSQERRFEGGGIRVRVGPYRARHVARDVFAAERSYLRDAIADEGADVVHAHWTYEYALAALDSDTPTLVTVRDWAPAILRYHPDPYRVVRLAMQLRTLRRARRLTVTSPYLERRVRWVTGRSPVLVPNAIADEIVDPRPTFGPAGVPPRLVAINNGWSRRKNVATLLRALPDIRRAVPGTELELVGTGYGPGEAAHRWALHHGLGEGVTFRGQLPAADTIAALRRSDLLVHPSREESFGLVLVEAMAQGTAVIGGVRSGAVPWVLHGGAAGRLVDVGDPAAIAACTTALLVDDGQRRALARRGHEHALTLTMSSVAGGYLRCYEEVAS